jgi:DNA-binding XRE family transcriptional regulator
MSEGKSKQFPYRALGYQLRSLREKNKNSVVEVSGAVEIDEEALVEIEKGAVLPSEDILLLLISYFSLKNDDALKIWKLAGYDKLLDQNSQDSDVLTQQNAVVLLPIDARVIYSDSVVVNKNKYGVVLNFMQNNSVSSAQPIPVARVGMSKEHAQSVIETLQAVLNADDKSHNEKRQSNKSHDPKNKK